jgi:hypothetical protein
LRTSPQQTIFLTQDHLENIFGLKRKRNKNRKRKRKELELEKEKKKKTSPPPGWAESGPTSPARPRSLPLSPAQAA